MSSWCGGKRQAGSSTRCCKRPAAECLLRRHRRRVPQIRQALGLRATEAQICNKRDLTSAGVDRQCRCVYNFVLWRLFSKSPKGFEFAVEARDV